MKFLEDMFGDLFESDLENVDIETDIEVSDLDFDNELGNFINEENEIQALFALNRMSNEIEESDMEAMENYFEAKDFSSEQFQGVINNWKGIYGEVEAIELLNEHANGSVEYVIPTDTNNPGVDIYGLDSDGNVVEKYQVKMSLDKSYINKTLENLPDDVKIICPTEIANEFDSTQIHDIGLSLEDVEGTIKDVCQVLVEKEPWEEELSPEFYSWMDNTTIKGH